VLEVGAGTGRNFPYLIDAVGPSGTVVAVDAAPGMLAQARRLVERRGWSNIELVQQDAARLELDLEFDGVLFSLSYSVLPERQPALAHAWERLRPSGRLAVMDAGLTDPRLDRLLGPIAKLLLKIVPGDPYSRPWEDLTVYGPVATERFMFGIYFVCVVEKQSQ
jgi:ubiquinone/menaquinone biosynthesis C-methylase UbiE